MAELANARIKKIYEDNPTTIIEADDILLLYKPSTDKTHGILGINIIPASDVSNYQWISTATYDAGDPVLSDNKWWISLIDGNIGNIPTEDSNWTQVNKVSGSGIRKWEAGLYVNEDEYVVHDLVLYELNASPGTPRPFNSVDNPLTDSANWTALTGSGKPYNYTATTDPGPTNDSNDTGASDGIGYQVGSKWLNTVSGEWFMAVSVADGGAVWEPISLSVDELNAIAVSGLTSGNGTTASGTAVNLGGSVTDDVFILIPDDGNTSFTIQMANDATTYSPRIVFGDDSTFEIFMSDGISESVGFSFNLNTGVLELMAASADKILFPEGENTTNGDGLINKTYVQSIQTFTLANELIFDDLRGKKSFIENSGSFEFTLSESGNVNGAVIEARINTPTTEPTFSTDFEQLSGGDAYDDTKLLRIFMSYDAERGKVDYIYKNSNALDFTAPTISSATVEDSADTQMVVVFNEAVTITDLTGLSLNFTVGVAKTLQSVAGSGTNTLTFTLSGSVEEGDVFTFEVAINNNIEDLSGNGLAAVSQPVANNVTEFSAEAQAVINLMTTPTSTEENAIANFVDTLVASGDWSLIDEFQFYRMDSEVNSLTGWKGLANGTNNSATWAKPTGFVGDGIAAWINTNFNPSTQSTNYLLGSGLLGYELIQNRHPSGTGGNVLATRDASVNSILFTQSTTPTIQFRINSNAISTYSGSTTFQVGNTFVRRVDGSNYQVVLNGTSSGNETSTRDTAIPNHPIAIGAFNNNGTVTGFYDADFGFFIVGGVGINTTTLNNAINQLKTDMGV